MNRNVRLSDFKKESLEYSTVVHADKTQGYFMMAFREFIRISSDIALNQIDIKFFWRSKLMGPARGQQENIVMLLRVRLKPHFGGSILIMLIKRIMFNWFLEQRAPFTEGVFRWSQCGKKVSEPILR